MFKVYDVTTPNNELNGKWAVEIANRTGIVHIKKPIGEDKLSSAIQVAPGYSKPFNQRFYQMTTDEQLVIKKLISKTKGASNEA